MELSIYDIIKGPVISDKAYKLNRTLNQLVLEVHVNANKNLVKLALQKLFSVNVKNVRILNRTYVKASGRSRRYKALPSETTIKIAYITLAEGYTLNLFNQAGVPSAQEDVRKHAEDNNQKA